MGADEQLAIWVARHAAKCRVLDCAPGTSPFWSLLPFVAAILGVALFVVSGASRRCALWTERVTARSWLRRVLFSVPLTLVAVTATWPARYYLERRLGVTDGPRAMLTDLNGNPVPFGSPGSDWWWLTQQLDVLPWLLLLGMILVPVAGWIVARWPSRYWLIATAGASLWLLWLADPPNYDIVEPLPDTPVTREVQRMAAEVGVPPDRLLIGRRKWALLTPDNAHAQWWEWRPTVIFGERMFNILPVLPENIKPAYEPYTAAEVRAVAGHELAHVTLWHGVLGNLLLIVLFGALCWLAALSARKLEARLALTGIGASAAVALTFATAYLIRLPAQTELVKVLERQADERGLAIARDPDGFAALTLRLARGGPLRPPLAQRVVFWTHPSPIDRLQSAAKWKALHGPGRWAATGASGPTLIRDSFRDQAAVPEEEMRTRFADAARGGRN